MQKIKYFVSIAQITIIVMETLVQHEGRNFIILKLILQSQKAIIILGILAEMENIIPLVLS